MKEKIKLLLEMLKRYKKQALGLLRLLCIVMVFTFLIFGLFYILGLVTFDNGIEINLGWIIGIKDTWYGVLLVIGMQVFITTALCFMPGITMAYMLLLPFLYDSVWFAFLVGWTGMIASSMSMYSVGRFGGRPMCERIVGKDDWAKASDLMCGRGIVYFPIMMFFPIFPDNALVMVAGTMKMKMSWFIPSVAFGRGVGVATTVLGLGSVPYHIFTEPWHWVIFVLGVLLAMIALFYIAFRVSRYMAERQNKK